jgi:hypothetical protein
MKKPIIKPYYPTELAELYGISYRQLYNWLKPYRDIVPKKRRQMLTVKEVEFIFGTFGRPEME